MIKAANERAAYTILGSADVTDEELTIAFTGAEALINSRPLMYQPGNPFDDEPLTLITSRSDRWGASLFQNKLTVANLAQESVGVVYIIYKSWCGITGTASFENGYQHSTKGQSDRKNRKTSSYA